MSVNKVILIGRVGQNPELKTTASGVPYLRVSLATSESWKDKASGEKKELTTWHNIKLYDNQAKFMSQALKKGSKIYVEGSLRTGEYEKNGAKVTYTEILARTIELLDRTEAPAQQAFTPQSTQSKPSNALDFLDDEVPF